MGYAVDFVSVLAELELTPLQEAIRQHFREGGSPRMVLLTVLGILSVIPLVYVLSRLQNRKPRPAVAHDPRLLYRDLLHALALQPSQREFMSRLAADLKLEHPTTLLLSRRIFTRAVRHWQKGAGSPKAATADLIQDVETLLFPQQDDVSTK